MIAVLLAALVTAAVAGPPTPPTSNNNIAITFDGDCFSPLLEARLAHHLAPFTAATPVELHCACPPTPTPTSTPTSPPESFSIVNIQLANGTRRIVAGGQPPEPPRLPRPVGYARARGSAYACYQVLQDVGFAFLHPLQPLAPPPTAVLDFARVANRTDDAPHWATRTWHVHTQHPLELTDLLTGFDLIINGSLVQPWEAMLGDWELFLEWAVANRLNRVEWLPLLARDWLAFGLSAQRQGRLRQLVELAHNYTLAAGADAAIALQQQHAFRLINTTEPAAARAMLKSRLEWLIVGAGFEFISTESGFSEFTHPKCSVMLEWMNLTTVLANELNAEVLIKCHCSSGQLCPDYPDPVTGKPIDFNFLPYYAAPELAVMPHTVQYYTLDQPTSGSYGTQNFSFMFDFLAECIGKRPVVYHPETAYWVDFDASVPLFLPIYAQGRVSDFRKIARHEAQINATIDGQTTFSSGWEWGYWINDVVTARSAWTPCAACADDAAALKQAFQPIIAAFGSAGAPLFALLTQLMDAQRDLLIYGLVDGKAPASPIKLNGQAYLQGWDTWAELAAITSATTQPNKLGLLEARSPLAKPAYTAQVQPLLREMNATFSALAAQFAALAPSIPSTLAPLYADVVAGSEMLALRAGLVFALYDYAALWDSEPNPWREQRLDTARAIMARATAIVREREASYRVPLARIGAWRPSAVGPTAYSFGYLWATHSLYFWWRDFAKATLTDREAASPCFRNIQDPINVALGEGMLDNATAVLWKYLETHDKNLDFVADCLHPPVEEPHWTE